MKLLTTRKSLGVTFFLLFSLLIHAQTGAAIVESPDSIMSVVEKMPQFPGGEAAMMKFFATNIKYPGYAQEHGIQGTVFVRFVVSKTGDVSKIEVMRSVDKTCDNEAVRVVGLFPKWTPGQQNGKNVSVYYTLPVKFKITSSGESPAQKPSPLYFVDGKEVSKAELDGIDKKQIKEVNVIKDMSELMKYGDKGKNGVVLISLKNAASVLTTDSIRKSQQYDVVEKMPVFPGGDIALFRFISSNLRYPAEAQKAMVQGTVYARFLVNKDGKVESPEILRSLSPECDRETLRVIRSMPVWTPGMQKGKNVSVWYTLPVRFRLK
ncbi:MAG: hypothetical protein RIS29_2044 [Bacteroidota bacterium]|jgi:TonB family protein